MTRREWRDSYYSARYERIERLIVVLACCVTAGLLLMTVARWISAP